MKQDTEKLIPFLGIFSVVLYFLHVILGEIFYEGYNPLAQAISDLTASNLPSKNIAKTFSTLYGICAVTFSLGFFAYFKNKINKVVTVSSFIFFGMNTISFFGYTFFPLSEVGYADTFQDKMHIIVTVFVVVLAIVSLILLTSYTSDVPNNTGKEMELVNYGATIGYIFFPKNKIHFFTGIQFAYNNIMFRESNGLKINRDITFFSIAPEINVEANILKFLRIYFGAGWHFAITDDDYLGLNQKTLNGFSINFGFLMGKF
jgi:hypothetical protein